MDEAREPIRRLSGPAFVAGSGSIEKRARKDYAKRIIVLASACAFAMVGAFALAGCSTNTEQQAGETQKPAEEQAKSESHEAVELQLFAANSLSKAMDAVQELYTQDHTWVTFKDTQYLSSGELNEQRCPAARTPTC